MQEIQNSMSEPISSVVIAKWILYGLGSLFGGVVHALIDLRAGKIKDTRDFMALAVISTFAGAIWCVLCQKIYDGDVLISLFGGMFGGVMSLNGLAILFNVLLKIKAEPINK